MRSCRRNSSPRRSGAFRRRRRRVSPNCAGNCPRWTMSANRSAPRWRHKSKYKGASRMIDESAYLADVAARQLRNWPASVPRTELKPFGDMALGDMLREWARVQPDKTAIIYYGREISYAELDRLSDRFAALLASRGIGKGDHVAVFMQNCPQFHIVFFGLMKLGAVHVPVNPMFKQIELAYELKDSAARALVALDQLYDLVREVRGETGI